MIRVEWPTDEIDWVHTACRVAGIPSTAEPADLVDALLNRADANGNPLVGRRYRRLAHDLGDALDELPRLEPPMTCDVCGATHAELHVDDDTVTARCPRHRPLENPDA